MGIRGERTQPVWQSVAPPFSIEALTSHAKKRGKEKRRLGQLLFGKDEGSFGILRKLTRII
jgi:hypothetical protein